MRDFFDIICTKYLEILMISGTDNAKKSLAKMEKKSLEQHY